MSVLEIQVELSALGHQVMRSGAALGAIERLVIQITLSNYVAEIWYSMQGQLSENDRVRALREIEATYRLYHRRVAKTIVYA